MTEARAEADRAPRVLFLCTGNAARSVMGAVSLSRWMPAAEVASAGTHVVEGQPPTSRTEQALLRLGLRPTGHRSHQLTEADVSWAEVIVGFTGDHVEFVRQRFPSAASKTATLRRLCRDLEAGSGLSQRLDRLGLAEVPLGAWEDVADPAGGELEDFERCADEIHLLAGRLARLLEPEVRAGQTDR